MSYTTIHQCANDEEFQARLMAAAAQEGHENPEYAMSVLLRWPVSAATDVAEAYEYAVNSSNPSHRRLPTLSCSQQPCRRVRPNPSPPLLSPQGSSSML